jgi:hypothetical protein
MRRLLRILADEAGGVTVETAMVLVLVTIASYLSFQTFGQVVRAQVAAVREPLVPAS